jgi:hypothetical protein
MTSKPQGSQIQRSSESRTLTPHEERKYERLIGATSDQLIPSEIARARPRPEKGDAKPAVCERVEDSMRGGGKKQESESDAETGV